MDLDLLAVADVSAWLGPGVETTTGWVPFKQKHKTMSTIPSECMRDSSTQMNSSNMNEEFI